MAHAASGTSGSSGSSTLRDSAVAAPSANPGPAGPLAPAQWAATRGGGPTSGVAPLLAVRPGYEGRPGADGISGDMMGNVPVMVGPAAADVVRHGRNVGDRIRALAAASSSMAAHEMRVSAASRMEAVKRQAGGDGNPRGAKRERKSIREKVRRDEVKIAFADLAELLGVEGDDKARTLAVAASEVVSLRNQSKSLVEELHRLHAIRAQLDERVAVQMQGAAQAVR